jgi:hypothetical protein
VKVLFPWDKTTTKIGRRQSGASASLRSGDRGHGSPGTNKDKTKEDSEDCAAKGTIEIGNDGG